MGLAVDRLCWLPKQEAGTAGQCRSATRTGRASCSESCEDLTPGGGQDVPRPGCPRRQETKGNTPSLGKLPRA